MDQFFYILCHWCVFSHTVIIYVYLIYQHRDQIKSVVSMATAVDLVQIQLLFSPFCWVLKKKTLMALSFA